MIASYVLIVAFVLVSWWIFNTNINNLYFLYREPKYLAVILLLIASVILAMAKLLP